jgi:hypothetical protein
MSPSNFLDQQLSLGWLLGATSDGEHIPNPPDDVAAAIKRLSAPSNNEMKMWLSMYSGKKNKATEAPAPTPAPIVHIPRLFEKLPLEILTMIVKLAYPPRLVKLKASSMKQQEQNPSKCRCKHKKADFMYLNSPNPSLICVCRLSRRFMQ